MNIKKYIVILATFLILFVGINNVYAKKNDWGEDVPEDTFGAPTDEGNLSSYTSNKCSNNGSCFKGLGLRLRLLYYNKEQSDDENVIATIYILNPNMLVDTVLTNGAKLPGSEADFGKGGFGLKYLDPTPKETAKQTDKQWITGGKSIPKQGGNDFSCGDGSTGTAVNNIYFKSRPRISLTSPSYGIPPVIPQDWDGFGFGHDDSQCNQLKIAGMTTTEANNFSLPFHWGYENFTFKYMSGYEKVIYLARSPYLNMNGADNYISDTDITEENIANNYLDSTLMKRYAGSLERYTNNIFS